MTEFVYVIDDTFTGANGTYLGAYTSNDGTTWAVDWNFVGSDPSDGELIVIDNNAFRKTNYNEAPGTGNGEVLIMPSKRIPPGAKQVSFEFGAYWQESIPTWGINGNGVGIYHKAPNPGNPDCLFWTGSNLSGLFGNQSLGPINPGIGVVYNFQVLLDLVNKTGLYYRDGALISSASFAAYQTPIFANDIGLDFVDSARSGAFHLTYFKVGVPPGAFWHQNLRCTEVDS